MALEFSNIFVLSYHHNHKGILYSEIMMVEL